MSQPYEVERWNTRARITVWAFVLGCAVLALAPLWGSPAFLSRSVVLFVYVLLAVTWNALAGYAGLMSVGQQAFFGLGAYFTIRLSDGGVPVFAAMAVAAGAVALVSVPISYVMLRLKAGEFAIGMWVLASLLHLLVNLDPLIQGETGISLLALNAFDPKTRMVVIYLFGLLSAVGVVAGMLLLLRSRFGAALQAIRDSEEAAGSIGVPVFRTKQLVFVFAALGAALAGALWLASTVSFQPKTYFGIQWMAYTVFMVIVGGIGTFEGALIGAVIFFVIETLLASFGLWYLILLGGTAVFFALAFPQGVWGYARNRHGWFLLPIGRTLITREKTTGAE
ncbi:branched-chain amino acid ABC transporter permease [Sinisalibacter aestuarii]|uniref:Branched-chain amino acid ABC transporter permease n=1 Tax=Sinisalibacter aestuarii TaxID=2949426 RepID=A0ABQ5LYU4_9RHOB|nr:branched-chain amino acid ABC transporter permease [Sinisalibacter aestuarii]GKY90125.1 branched-chain amino acid ABC transporter permease [Sinisalibacter aestuarii]